MHVMISCLRMELRGVFKYKPLKIINFRVALEYVMVILIVIKIKVSQTLNYQFMIKVLYIFIKIIKKL